MHTPAWHALDAAQALAQLEAGAQGLTSAQARARLARHGPNALRITPPRPALAILLDQLRSLIVALLVAASVVSLATGDLADALAIGVVIVLNVTIGFLIELRARRTMEALGRLDVGRANALRDGEPTELDSRELVPGDVVLLEAGDAVPADMRVLAATELSTNEAPLTGESLPVAKGVAAVPAEALVTERSSLLHKGTLVSAGTGRALVVATGADTEIGRLTELVAAVEEEDTPLERRLAALGRRLVWVALGVAALVTLLGWLRGGDPWLMLETGIALAVAAVPEGLPVVATITLAVGMHRMARRAALVRRLPAVETLGSVTVIATDKTGTLTAGEMTAGALLLPGRRFDVSGAGLSTRGELRHADALADPVDDEVLARALAVALLCNRARLEPAEGDATEVALLVLGAKAGVDRGALQQRAPELGELPFSSERMLMATFHAEPGGGTRVLVKGAPERVIASCTSEARGGGAVTATDGGGHASAHDALDDAGRRRWLAANERLAAEGLRVLALADRVLPADTRADARADAGAVTGLCLLGLVGFRDPPADGVRETIASLRGAGIRVLMITGDQHRTAEAVARELGVLAEGHVVMDGPELAALSDDELGAALAHVAAFSRVSPADKLRIVDGLQARGEVVGMLGDGVNDAAALKGADIGVAMGRRGTDVARETADVVLLDDRLHTVAVAVEGGRVIDDDIRKVILFLFSGNLAEVLVLLVAGVVGLPVPLLPLQILWINLVSDVFPALALAMEPAEGDVMRRPPSDPRAPILSRGFTRLVGAYALLVMLPTLAVFVWALDGGEARARTLAFLVLGLAQVGHALNARHRRPLPLGDTLRGNAWLLGAMALSGGLMFAAVLVPGLARVLGVASLSGVDVVVVAVASLVPLLGGRLRHAWHARRAVRA